MDSVSCLAVHEKFIAVGTEWGRIHVLDHNGFPIENGIYSVHSTSVNEISISEQGYYIASCGDDGRLVIYNLSLTETDQLSSFDYAIKAVALAPDYEKSRNVVIGFQKIRLLSKGILTKAKHEDLAKVSGLVRTINWHNEFILWADDERICVYDTRDHRPITFIQYSSQDIESPGLPTVCSLCWCTDNCFLIARGQSIRICQILERNPNPDDSLHSSHSSFTHQSSQSLASSEVRIGLPSRYVEIVYQVNMNGIVIRGISRHQSCLLLLSSVTDTSHKPGYEICVLDIDLDSTVNFQQYKEIYREKLPFQSTDSHSIGLASVPHENTHYIFSKKEVFCAQELTLDDRIDWLLENNLFLKGLEIAQQHPRLLTRHTIQSVGIIYVDHLLSGRHFDEAGKLCSQVLSTKEAWEEHIQKFYSLGHLEAIVPYIPVGGEEKSAKLNTSVYELILIDYMNRIPVQFVHLLTEWYCIEHRTSLSEAIDISKLDLEVQALYHGLAVAYEQMGSYEQAINILVRLRDPQVLFF
ncbi:unnamed protein product [Heterobilharzia americana]|nr:unnamed protein product [Heterobilharzia americana]